MNSINYWIVNNFCKYLPWYFIRVRQISYRPFLFPKILDILTQSPIFPSLRAADVKKPWKWGWFIPFVLDILSQCIFQSWTLIRGHKRNMAKSAFPRTYQKCLFSVCYFGQGRDNKLFFVSGLGTRLLLTLTCFKRMAIWSKILSL